MYIDFFKGRIKKKLKNRNHPHKKIIAIITIMLYEAITELQCLYYVPKAVRDGAKEAGFIA